MTIDEGGHPGGAFGGHMQHHQHHGQPPQDGGYMIPSMDCQAQAGMMQHEHHMQQVSFPPIREIENVFGFFREGDLRALDCFFSSRVIFFYHRIVLKYRSNLVLKTFYFFFSQWSNET